MTNYLTAVGVQQVSITIASGSLTGTASITAVGSGAFVIWQGSNATDTSQADDTTAYVTLTNSTTVTATRGASGTSKTMVVNAIVVDGDTTNLIKSVQFGTITIASGSSSNTAAISAVTNTNTALAYLGQTALSSTNANNTFWAKISLSGTTVTASTGSNVSATSGVKVGFCVIEFQGTALNSSVQNVAFSSSSAGTSFTSTISSVTTSNAFVSFGGYTSNNSTPSIIQPNLALTSSTQLTIAYNTSNATARAANACIIEFVSGVLAQAVQRGTIALSAATSNTATITSSATVSTMPNWLNNTTNSASVSQNITSYNIKQSNATTLTLTANSSATGIGSYEVVQFTFSSGTPISIDIGMPDENLVTARVDPPLRMEMSATFSTDRFVSAEFLRGKNSDRGIRLEALSALRADLSETLETLASQRADTYLPLELIASLVVVMSDAFLPTEMLRAVGIDAVDGMESLALALRDAPIRQEMLAGLKGDAGVPSETTGILLIDRKLPDEMNLAARAGSVCFTEILAAVTRDGMFPSDGSAAQVAKRSVTVETLALLRTDEGAPFEFPSGTTSHAGAPQEILSATDRDFPLVDETTGTVAVSADVLLPNEWLGAVASNETAVVETVATVRLATTFPEELLARQIGNTGTPSEFVATQTVDSDTRAESLATLFTDVVEPAEVAAALAADYGALTELLATASAGAFSPLEIVGTILHDDAIQVEFNAVLVRDQPLPTEWTGTTNLVVGNTLLPAEWFAEVTVNWGLPAEATNTPAPTPCRRILDPRLDNRTLDASLDDRILEPSSSNRTINARARIRILKPNPSSRTI